VKGFESCEKYFAVYDYTEIHNRRGLIKLLQERGSATQLHDLMSVDCQAKARHVKVSDQFAR